MKIYPAEIEAGISEKLCQASIINVPIKYDLFCSASYDDRNLYPIKSVLVSTGWNKNDDVFDKYEVWKARDTATNQKIDFEHDELTIIGHITNSFAFSDDGVIPDETPLDDLPDKYHLFTEGFLYTYWQDEKRRQLVNQIIAEIPSDKWFVSMECLFDNFDYALTKADSQWIIKRNAETAFLSKNLRIYGGSGEYLGYRVGRYLRDFSFVGKGIVSQPANPDSVILDPEDFTGLEVDFVDFSQSSVCKNMKENDMSDTLKELAEAQAKIKELETALVNEKAQSHVAKAAELDVKVQTLETQLATASCERDSFSTKLVEAQKAIENLKAELANEQAKVEAANKEKEQMAKKAKCSQRAMKLVEAGLTETEAADKATKWADVSEDIFDEFVGAVKASKKEPKEATVEAEVEVEEVTEATADETPIPSDESGQDDEVMTAIAKYMTSKREENKKIKESK